MFFVFLIFFVLLPILIIWHMNVQELIDLLMEIEDKSKEVHTLSPDHSNDPVHEVYEQKDIVYICG